mmetsp:Transcript_11253/g.33318  ORF Transcript_11253/g.33318 Transcript_11253/m.33318 type:complete len:232 (-) Transcript_11253:332-1027(-)
MAPSITVVGACDASLSGCKVVLSQIVEASAARGSDSWSLSWDDAGTPAFEHMGDGRALQHVECCSIRGTQFHLVAVNTDVSARASGAKALSLLDELRARNMLDAVFVLSALRFMPDPSSAQDCHMSKVGPMPAPLPGRVASFTQIPSAQSVNDPFIGALLMALRGSSIPSSIVAVSSITSASVDAAEEALGGALAGIIGSPKASKGIVSCRLAPKRYTDALVETNGCFLYT